MSAYYPVMLDLAGRSCLIVGGGQVAERKLVSLLEAGAKVTVLSPDWTQEIDRLRRIGALTLLPRVYAVGDASRYTLVFAATDDRAVNEQVTNEAAANGIWVSVADKPESGTFILPSVVRRGKLILAVSTSGASPSLAGKIARELGCTYGDEYEAYVDFLSEARLKIRAQVQDRESRERIFRRLLDADVLTRVGSHAWKRELLDALETAPSLSTLETFLGRA